MARLTAFFVMLIVLAAPVLALGQARQPQTPKAEWGQYFPDDYRQSRDRIRDDCKRLNGVCASLQVESATDRDLTIDTAFFSKDAATRLLVVQSGIHGSEAEAGAAVQRLLMNRYLPALQASGIDVLIIHALNPWGFVHHRRTDEWNVNLNRNFSLSGDIFKTPSDYYARYRDIFEPAGTIESAFRGRISVELAFARAFVTSGFDSEPINMAFASGQYESKDGMNYGGDRAAQQTGLLRRILEPLVTDAKYSKIFFLDYHTGLGDDGVLAVIKGVSTSKPLMREFACAIGVDESPPAGQPARTGPTGGIVIKSGSDEGFFPTVGDVIDFVPELAPKDKPDSILAVTMEYGTKGGGMVAQIATAAEMILENQKYHHRCTNAAACDSIDKQFRALFNPTDDVWRAAVIAESEQVFDGIATRWRDPVCGAPGA